MTKIEQMWWKWNQPVNEGKRIIIGLAFWSAACLFSIYFLVDGLMTLIN